MTEEPHKSRLPRRRFLRRTFWGAVGGVFGGGALLSEFGERNWPRAYRRTIRLPGLPDELRGFTIAQLSDLHRGPLVGEELIRRGVALANRLRPDLIVVTGDYVTASAGYAASCAAALAELRAPAGVFATLGNHDYWTDVEAVSDAVAGAGLRLLVNQSACLTSGGRDWWLCGTDDVWSGEPDLDRTVRDDPPGAFKILLCHEPDYADQAVPYGFPLQLSGHSHAGQVLIPGCRPFVTPLYGRKYPIGLQRVEGSPGLVYTNVGLGVIFVPVRLNCPPEVTLITLEKAAA